MKDLESRSTKALATRVVAGFVIPPPVDGVEPYGHGLINTTFLVIAREARYILQRINASVFPEPERIMSNVATLQRHCWSHAECELRIPALVAARDGLPFVRDGQGGTWRLMEFIPNTKGLARIEDLKQAREVGRILGSFHLLVSDMPADRLAVTLPGFHVTPGYLEQFRRTLAGCAGIPTDEIARAVDFVTLRQSHVDVLENARKSGEIPESVIHGDPKLDNILFDSKTGRAVSLIDLDTVQPGLIHYDIGDCLRSCCRRGGGSEGMDATFDLEVCRAILGAYANEVGGLLDAVEIELLFDAIRLIPFELGLRFLTDHLEGDRYFRVNERGQNLRKAGVQFALVEDIEGKERDVRRIVAACFGK
ncbi:MAG: aminoglycoside phosphotransferase family protein [Chromatiaceae bacterium]|nr:aminoglycoside phosphotransferase family protein [Chromatiaceae bacterium]